MRRREFIVLTAGATIIWPFVSATQEAGRTYRLGILAPFPRETPASLPFFDELPRRGFIEGQNLTIYYRDFGPHVDLISEYAAELVKNRVDVIWGAGGAAIRATQQATKTIPIFGMADDMLGIEAVIIHERFRLIDAIRYGCRAGAGGYIRLIHHIFDRIHDLNP